MCKYIDVCVNVVNIQICVYMCKYIDMYKYIDMCLNVQIYRCVCTCANI